jgi:hypothetical protein
VGAGGLVVVGSTAPPARHVRWCDSVGWAAAAGDAAIAMLGGRRSDSVGWAAAAGDAAIAMLGGRRSESGAFDPTTSRLGCSTWSLGLCGCVAAVGLVGVGLRAVVVWAALCVCQSVGAGEVGVDELRVNDT